MSNTNLHRLVAPCGLDCFNCDYYVDNISPEIISHIAKLKDLEIEEIPCKGCQVENGCKYHDYKCETLDCIKNKAIDYCFQCDGFPCSMLQPASDSADRLPHNFKLYNLCRMKLIGIDNWIAESKLIRVKYFKGKLIVGTGPILEPVDK